MALPRDVKLGYAASAAFAAWFALGVLYAPDLLLFASGVLVYPALAVGALVLFCRLAVPSTRWRRVLSLVLVSACLATAPLWFKGGIVDLHLIARVYGAGGPNTLNDWAQGVIKEHSGEETQMLTVSDGIPKRIRNALSGRADLFSDPQSGQAQVHIELGGGFYHYGVDIYRTGTQPPPKWWQRVLGWPSEVVVYHE